MSSMCDEESSDFSSDEETVVDVGKFKGAACPPALNESEHYLMFTLTVSSSFPFTDIQLAGIKDKLSSRKYCCVVIEMHKNGTRHIHGVVSGTKNAGGLTRVFERLYGDLEIPYVKYVSVKVKSVSSLAGAIHYCTKSSGSSPLFLLKGWTRNWITDQYRSQVLKMPSKVLMKGWTILQRSTAIPTIINWIKAHDLVPNQGSERFMGEIMLAMMQDHYIFTNISGQLRMIGIQLLVEFNCPESDSIRRCMDIAGMTGFL